MKDTVKVENLVNEFEGMAERGTLLSGGVAQKDLLMQIIGTIVKVTLDEERSENNE